MQKTGRLNIANSSSGPVSSYAVQELRRFIEKYTCWEVTEGDSSHQADREIRLAVESDLPDSCCRIHGQRRSGPPAACVTVTGGNESSLLYGVYRLLDKMGLQFDINGESLWQPLDLAAADSLEETFRPFCRNRGIRQHINFPMDISSYHLEQAREYIRNMARMGLNAITFHSYNGQWHCYSTESKEILAGNFFYGQRHPIPHDPLLEKKVDNDRDFCIPEAEAIIDDPQKRSDFAVRWLGKLMDTAKEAGIRITLSLELPDQPMPVLIRMVQGVLDSYPQLDVLEWISPEGGGETRPVSRQEARELIVQWFGEAAVPAELPEEPPLALEGTLKSLRRAAALYGHCREIFQGRKVLPVQIGLYVTCPETLKLCKQVMDRALPEEVTYSFLPAHGAKAVRDNIAYMDFAGPELQRTMLYSWIEFDGNMYLLQNSCDGISQLVELTRELSEGEAIHGICLNHWRTAENALCIAYAARAMETPISPQAFYEAYAVRCGIGLPGQFADAMEQLGSLDIHNRDRLFNIGFCYLGCWLGPKGLGWIRDWKEEDMEFAAASYGGIAQKLRLCLAESNPASTKGIGLLRLLINRADCSILHIRAIGQLKKICAFADDSAPEKLTAEEKAQVLSCCDRALELCREYLTLHLEQLPDRGCQGTAVSYYATLPTYIDHIRQYFVYGEKECRHRPSSFDQPPPPDTAYLHL